MLPDVADSKTLKPAQREALVPQIIAQARGAAIGLATAAEVDELNVLNATLLAAQRALDSLARPPEFLITDYLRLKKASCPQLSIARGDSTSLCVAAASILAKVARDRIMTLLDREYPQYGFARHKAYGTQWRAISVDDARVVHDPTGR